MDKDALLLELVRLSNEYRFGDMQTNEFTECVIVIAQAAESMISE